MTDSAIASAAFTVVSSKHTVATPTLLPTGGLYTKKVPVTLKCATAGATIRYTLNGTDPTSSATLYKAGAISVTNSCRLKARAFKTGFNDSAVATGDFTVVVPAPLAITTPEVLTNGTVQVKYKATLTAVGGTLPYKWALASGSKLPAGLSLSAAGVISGKPSKPGPFGFTVKVTDAAKLSVAKLLNLTIDHN